MLQFNFIIENYEIFKLKKGFSFICFNNSVGLKEWKKIHSNLSQYFKLGKWSNRHDKSPVNLKYNF